MDADLAVTSPAAVRNQTLIGAAVKDGYITSIYDPVSQEYEIGGRGSNGGVWLGKIFAVEIRSGIDGGIVNPQPIESWAPRGPSGSYIPGSFGGSPTIRIWNGAMPGMGYSYFSDATRFPKMVPAMSVGVAYQSCSHNDGALAGSAYWAVRDSWLTQLKARCPSAIIAVLNQNPRCSPDPDHTTAYQARRAVEMVSWAQRSGVAMVDTYRDFVTDARGYTTLIEPVDGIHPTQGMDGGQGVIARCVWQS